MPLPGGTSELRSTGPNLVPLLATRFLYQGLCLSSGQLDTNLVLLMATRCLYWGGVGASWGIGGDGVGVQLTKHQPDPQADQMSC